jgi:hypothetical protein
MPGLQEDGKLQKLKRSSKKTQIFSQEMKNTRFFAIDKQMKKSFP